MKLFNSTIFGILFGIILTKAEVISWFRINNMFHFTEAHMYLIIGSAIITGAISYVIIKKFSVKSIDKQEIVIEKKELNKGTVIGGILFGIGWAITGACPGPIFAQIGAGEYPALITFAGALVGAYLYSISKSKLPD
ncbi:MAG: transporter [Ignavibacteriae bacterium HGW-Ignavibacteriae-2]|jgi:hypothetical protein|nr:YeeE/YedE family protein [Bacteroidota bacterium]PKL90075.1 MAG: transporter [Ignavibacteriae bacterium HGW-Ignavibacteriae-2]